MHVMGRMDTGINPLILTYPMSGLPEGLQGGRALLERHNKNKSQIFTEYLLWNKHLVTIPNVLHHLILTTSQ